VARRQVYLTSRFTIGGAAGPLVAASAEGDFVRLFYTAPMAAVYRDEPCRTALNRVRNMPFAWSLNPYMGCAHRCTFCFVRAFERVADRPWDARYGTSIRVKTNLVEVLRRELSRRTWRREKVAVGTATDPYQPAEGRFRLTRGAIIALGESRTPFGLITRGPLVVRDVDVLSDAARRASVGVTFSIPTIDHVIWRRTEPGTAPPRQRLRAIRTLIAAGIDTSVGMAPILPGLSDDPAKMAEVVRAARDAGATSIWANVLYLRPGTREHFLGNLARDWPELLPRYEHLYARRAYLPDDLVNPVRRRVRDLATAHGVADRRPWKLEPSPDAEPEQLPLTAFLQEPGQLPDGLRSR
jgi:DNA repair photolyase